jgi:hypothetical protein
MDARLVHDGAFVDEPAGLAALCRRGIDGPLRSTLGAGNLLQGNEGGSALDALSAKPHTLDGPAGSRGADPGLRGAGGLPRGRERSDNRSVVGLACAKIPTKQVPLLTPSAKSMPEFLNGIEFKRDLEGFFPSSSPPPSLLTAHPPQLPGGY